MLGDHTQDRARAPGDEHGGMGLPHRVGIAERAAQLNMRPSKSNGSVSVHSRLITVHARQGIHGVREADVGQAVGVVLLMGLGHARARPDTDAEVEPPPDA